MLFRHISIQIVTNQNDLLKVSELCNKHKLLSPVLGGNERHKSVYSGLLAIANINPNPAGGGRNLPGFFSENFFAKSGRFWYRLMKKLKKIE